MARHGLGPAQCEFDLTGRTAPRHHGRMRHDVGGIVPYEDAHAVGIARLLTVATFQSTGTNRMDLISDRPRVLQRPSTPADERLPDYRALTYRPVSTSATTGAIARSALPRWEIASFSCRRQLRAGARSVLPVGDEQDVVAEAAVPALLADDPAAASRRARRAPRSRRADGVGERDRAAELRAAALVGDVGQLVEQQPVVAASSLAAPDQRAESTPGMPLRASTQSPLSSASDGQPGRRRRRPAP